MWTARAPGKLVISGEYAILDGAPAIVAAVDVCAEAILQPGSDEHGSLVDRTSGERFSFQWSPQQGLRWTGAAPGQRGAIPAAVFATLANAGALSREHWPALEIALDTRQFEVPVSDAAVKLGLGSSAAILVALMGGVLAASSQRYSTAELRRWCCAAHRDFQNGAGSGADVLAVLEGGVVGVRPVTTAVVPEVVPLGWPAGLHLIGVWTGCSASTTSLLGRFEDYRARQPESFRSRLDELQTAAERSLLAWQDDAAGAVCAALRKYDAALTRLDHDAGIGIYSAEHAELRRLSEAAGAFYKVSGAGGGDFGLAGTDSAEVYAKLRSALARGGYRVLELSGSVAGLTVVTEA